MTTRKNKQSPSVLFDFVVAVLKRHATETGYTSVMTTYPLAWTAIDGKVTTFNAWAAERFGIDKDTLFAKLRALKAEGRIVYEPRKGGFLIGLPDASKPTTSAPST